MVKRSRMGKKKVEVRATSDFLLASPLTLCWEADKNCQKSFLLLLHWPAELPSLCWNKGEQREVRPARKTTPPSPSQYISEDSFPPGRKRAHLSIGSTLQSALLASRHPSCFSCHPPLLRDFKFQLWFQSSQSSLTHWALPPANWEGSEVGRKRGRDPLLHSSLLLRNL